MSRIAKVEIHRQRADSTRTRDVSIVLAALSLSLVPSPSSCIRQIFRYMKQKHFLSPALCHIVSQLNPSALTEDDR